MNHDDGHNGGRGTGMNTARADSAARQSVIVVGGGIGGLAAALALTRQGVEVQLLEQASRIGEIGAGIKLGPNAFAALDALGVGRAARARRLHRPHHHDGRGRCPRGGAHRYGRGLPRPFRRPLRRHPPRRHPPVHPGSRATGAADPLPHLHPDRRRVAARRARRSGGHAGPPLPGRCRDRRRRRQVRDPPADGGRSGARHRPCGLPGRGRARQHARGTAHQRARALGRPALPPGPLSAARRPAIQPGRHLPQPRAGGMGRARRQQGRSAVVLPGHTPAPAPDAGPAHFVEALGHRRPRAGRALGPGTRHAAGRRRASHDPVHGARRLHGAGRRRDAGRGRARLRPRPEAAFRRYESVRIPRSARVVWSTREMGRLYHAHGVERTVRNSLWTGRSQSQFQDALQWLYGWKVEQCLAGPIQP